jgi:hypothetical protein
MNEDRPAYGRQAGRQPQHSVGHPSNPLTRLIDEIRVGDIGQVSDAHLRAAATIVAQLQAATGQYAVRAVVARGWPQPTRDRCRLSKNLYRRAVRTLALAGLLTDMRRGEHPVWRAPRENVEAWLRNQHTTGGESTNPR